MCCIKKKLLKTESTTTTIRGKKVRDNDKGAKTKRNSIQNNVFNNKRFTNCVCVCVCMCVVFLTLRYSCVFMVFGFSESQELRQPNRY